MLPQILAWTSRRSLHVSCLRYQRGPFGKPKRTFEDRNRYYLKQHLDKNLKLAKPVPGKPIQFQKFQLPDDPTLVTRERKLLPLKDINSPYQKYSQEDIDAINDHDTFYDPLFNPLKYDDRDKVDPEEEPFNAIYADSKTANEYTKVRNVTTPELWDYVESLARINIAPRITRKSGEPIVALPSGFVPPPENPPDLPYFVPRTRSNLLPVYYHLGDKNEECYTVVRQVTGDLWKLEEDLRTYLESLDTSQRKILTSVHETDARVLFKGRHVHRVVDWLHSKGF